MQCKRLDSLLQVGSPQELPAAPRMRLRPSTPDYEEGVTPASAGPAAPEVEQMQSAASRVSVESSVALCGSSATSELHQVGDSPRTEPALSNPHTPPGARIIINVLDDTPEASEISLAQPGMIVEHHSGSECDIHCSDQDSDVVCTRRAHRRRRVVAEMPTSGNISVVGGVSSGEDSEYAYEGSDAESDQQDVESDSSDGGNASGREESEYEESDAESDQQVVESSVERDDVVWRHPRNDPNFSPGL